MDLVLELFMEHMKWILSGIGVPIIIYIFSRKPSAQNIIVNVEPNRDSDAIDGKIKQPDIVDSDILSNSYRFKVGRKHKWLRESIFKLTLREIASFYGMSEVGQIEKYESGEVELPMNCIDKLEDFFFINKNVIDGDKDYMFKTFHLCQESISDLFEQGFKVRIACCPDNRGDLFCYIVMHKEENGFTRIIVSDLVSSFMSSGGGRMNIQYLINELILRGIPDHRIPILTTTKEEWKKLEQNSYYDIRLFHGFGTADRECLMIFNQWYLETSQTRNLNKS